MSRLHTRMVFTPTGPTHIFHAMVARINKAIAEWSGGSFVYRFENTLATQADHRWRDDRMAVSTQNLEEMYALGLAPTSPAVLRDLGFPPGIGVEYQQGRSLADHYWQLWGLGRYFGDWPPPYPEGTEANSYAAYTRPARPNLGVPIEHPYVVLSRVAEDIHTGRNMVIRGDDLRQEAALYGMFARMILPAEQEFAAQYFLPRWGMCDDLGQPVVISSSSYQDYPNMPGMVRDVLDAERTGDELFEWMDRHLLKPGTEENFLSTPEAACRLLTNNPIPLKSWLDFIQKGHRRKQSYKGGRG